MIRKEKTTVQDSFVGANEEQPQINKSMNSIAENDSADKQNFLPEMALPVEDTISDEDKKQAKPEAEPQKRPCSGNSLITHSLTEILDATFQPQIPLIDGMLYEGTYLFAGSPKVGKSFMMAQIAYHVSTGLDMWEMKVNKAPVLYLALEDTYSRIQKRLSRMFDLADSDQLHFAIRAKMIHQGLEEQLMEFLKEHPDTKLVIIDTLQKVRTIGEDKSMYGSDYEVVSRVKAIADQYHLCVLFVHHTRKKKAEDVFEEISGSQGLMGAADGAFIMKKKKRTSDNATIEISGRDQPDTQIDIIRDRERCYWKLEKMERELWKEHPEPIVEKIVQFLTTENSEWTGSASELLEALEETDMAPNVLTRRLNTKVELLLREYSIEYSTTHTHKERTIKLKRITK